MNAQRGGEGARALADRLADRPQPGQVDVGVADGADDERWIAALLGQLGRQDQAGQARRVVRDVAEDQGGLGQRGPDALVARAVLGQLLHQLAQHFDVVGQRAQVRAADGDRGFLERAAFLQAPEQVVAAGVGPQVDGLPAGGLVEERHDALAGLAQAVVELGVDRGQPLHRVAVAVHHAGLAVDVDQQHDRLPGGLGRHPPGEVEPGAVEQVAPLLPRRQGDFAAGLPLRVRHRLAGDVGGHVERRQGEVDGVENGLLQSLEFSLFVKVEVWHGFCVCWRLSCYITMEDFRRLIMLDVNHARC